MEYRLTEEMLRRALSVWTKSVGPVNVFAAELKSNLATLLFLQVNITRSNNVPILQVT